MVEHNLDIVGLCETNLGERGGKYMFRKFEGFKAFWSEIEADKNKGSGVGLIVREK